MQLSLKILKIAGGQFGDLQEEISRCLHDFQGFKVAKRSGHQHVEGEREESVSF